MNNFSYMTDRDFSKGRKYIGASDCPTLSGSNPYQTPFEFWEIFTGRKEGFKGNDRTRAGHIMEPIILAEYIEKSAKLKGLPNGRDLKNDFVSSRMFGDERFEGYHSWTEAHPPENDRFTAHADLLDLTGKIPVLIQAKNSGMMAANTRKRNPFKGYAPEDLSQNGIPLSVYLQVQWEMYCYGVPSAYVAVMIDGWDHRVYGAVEYRKKDVEKLVVLADRMLWHVDNDKPPTPQSWPDVLSMFPDLEKNTKSTVSGQDELDAKKIISEIAKIDEKSRLLYKAKLDRTMALALFASEPDLGVMHNYLTSSNGTELASFSERAGNWRISIPALKKFPELYKQCDESGLITQDASTRSIKISGANAGSVDLFTLISYDYDGSKPKRSRKKYTRTEKKAYTDFCKSVAVKIDWERYSTK